MLAVGDLEKARAASRELGEIAERYESGMLAAMVEQARGAVDLADGDAQPPSSRCARPGRLWHDLEAPYEAARVRVLVGLACRALGDDDTAAMELEAARGVFAQLGAAPDLARVDTLAPTRAVPTSWADAAGAAGTPPGRAGATNKAIAAELVLSERTVDRHVSNILMKLRVPTRAAATAFAYEHKLV